MVPFTIKEYNSSPHTASVSRRKYNVQKVNQFKYQEEQEINKRILQLKKAVRTLSKKLLSHHCVEGSGLLREAAGSNFALVNGCNRFLPRP